MYKRLSIHACPPSVCGVMRRFYPRYPPHREVGVELFVDWGVDFSELVEFGGLEKHVDTSLQGSCPWGAGVLSGLPPLAVVPTRGFAVGCLPLSLFPSTWVCPPEGGPLCNLDRVACPWGGRIIGAPPLVALVPSWGHAS